MNGVSVVITTVNRPKILNRAILSVLNQTYRDIEIIIVVDGAASETLSFIKKNYPKCKIISPSPNVGGSEARNLGIRAATKKYVALLDDDDEWLPHKLKTQMEKINKQSSENICCFSSVYTYFPKIKRKFIFPRKRYKGDNFGDYIFGSRCGFRTGAIQTSTIVAPKSVFEKVPFVKNLPKHQDWTWALDVHKKDINYIHINEPLSIYHKDANTNGISKKYIWEFSKKWIDERKNDISQNSYNNFMLFVVQNGISKDKTKSRLTKMKLLREINKEIPFLYNFTLTSIRYRLQCFFQILKN